MKQWNNLLIYGLYKLTLILIENIKSFAFFWLATSGIMTWNNVDSIEWFNYIKCFANKNLSQERKSFSPIIQFSSSYHINNVIIVVVKSS